MSAMLGACAGAATVATPGGVPPGVVDNAGEAVASVVASEPRLSGIQPFDSGMVGQSSWYAVTSASGVGAFLVEVHVGWGDCEAGCINDHSWVYAVMPDGTVRVQRESGPPVPDDAWPSQERGAAPGVSVTVVAGPVCPVQADPPDPDCAPRPVANATIVIRDMSGAEVARLTTNAAGQASAELPAGGYVLEPQPVEGLMGTAPTTEVTVEADRITAVQLEYDTGIR
jgi:hypothetical protein